jgi:RHS repeat-associated protein
VYWGVEEFDVGLAVEKFEHMNGRLFDPYTGRFLSADFYIQSPQELASYNRYAYCWNSPALCTDPSGYFVKWLARKVKQNLSHLNEYRKDLNRETLKAYNWLRDADPLTHYLDKAMMRSSTLRKVGQVVAGVADILGCAGVCSAAYSAHIAAISGGTMTDVTIGAISGYATGQMAMSGYGALNTSLAATARWAAGTYINMKTSQAVGRYLIRHTNLTGRDIVLIQAGLTLAGAMKIDGIGGAAIDIAGKVWNAPNTAVGLVYGGVGHIIGEVGNGLNLYAPEPSINIGNNAIQFINNPLMRSYEALTLGNTIHYGYNSPPEKSGAYGDYS